VVLIEYTPLIKFLVCLCRLADDERWPRDFPAIGGLEEFFYFLDKKLKFLDKYDR